jgi:serine/threonine protein phosphatase 1
MVRTIVISDIHGHYNKLIELLSLVNYNPKIDHLYFLGDYVDKGPDSKKVIQKIIELSKLKGVKTISGNHDELFLRWLDKNEYKFMSYTSEKTGGTETILSFAPFFQKGINDDETRTYILKNYHQEVTFLRNLPYYIEDENHIYVHAGVDLKKENWKDTSEKNFRWIRKKFLDELNHHDKTIVFGHTVTNKIRNSESDFSIWFGDKKIGIDGGIKFNGQLNALVIEENKYKSYFVKF